jgi:hypothetical protein
MEGGLRVDEALELTPIEEDAATLRALVDVNTAALVLPHCTVTFRTGQLHGPEATDRFLNGSWEPLSEPATDIVRRWGAEPS